MLKITELDKKQRYLIKATFWLIGLVLGALQAWANRYKPSSGDIISYLDMGDAYLRGDWEQAIHGYFSPLYAWIVSFFLLILKPSMYWEFFAVKIVNFSTYIFSFICFEFLLVEFIYYYNKKFSKIDREKYYVIPEWVWLISGYVLFLWSALKLIGVDKDTPDMLVAAVIYLATAIVLRVNTRSERWINFIMLGVILGLGYLTKTFMFPMAFVFLGTCFFSITNKKRSFFRVLVALLVFSLIATPFVYALSKSKGYLTFGDNGKLNYAWYFGELPTIYWQGEPPGSGTPKHPVRKIFNNPSVYEFGMHFEKATLPIGYDSSYWYEGMTPKFNFVKQINISAKNLLFYYQQFLGALVFGYLILVSLSGRFGFGLKELAKNWRLFVPAVAGLILYMLATDMPAAQPSMRYIAPCIILLFAGAFASVYLPNSQESQKLITGITISTLILMGVQFTDLWQPPRDPIYWKVAQGLYHSGIHSRDKVAVIQLRGRNGTEEFWARLARLTIVADIPDAKSFWQTDTSTRAKVYEAIKETGAKAIVQKLERNTPDYLSVAGWQEIENTGYYAYFLQK